MARELAFEEAEWRRRADSLTFIAERSAEPVGLVTAICRPAGDETDSPPEWELVSMWVRPDVRGQGYADQLVSAVAEAVRAQSADQLTLWVADGNARARAFYLRAGFRSAGISQVFSRHDGSAFDEENS